VESCNIIQQQSLLQTDRPPVQYTPLVI